MCRTIRIFNQTFIQADNTKPSGKFRFTRVMKTNHLQKFRIKVLGITNLNSSAGGLLYLKDLPEITGNCNIQTNNGGAMSATNNFYLGSLDFNTADNVEPEMLVDEIPLDDFTVVRRDATNANVNGGFVVSFQIELMDGYKH